jgi:cytochrome c2
MRHSVLLLNVIFTASLAMAVSPAMASDDEPNLSPRITQDQIENQLSLQQIRREGQRIFSTPFNNADGLGDGPIDPLDKVSPGGRPTFRNHGSLLRFNGLDSQTCLECHNMLSTKTIPASFAVGGVGGLSQAAFPGDIDPDIDDSENNGYARVQGRVINPPFSFGSGGVELVGKEMTQELQAQKQQAQDNPNTSVDLVAKGVSFGSISYDGVAFDFSNIEGIGVDLVIRPFGRTGCCATVREFDTGAMQFHHGIQPVEVVGPDNDADGDGVANELLEGELSAMHIFQVSLERPRQKNFASLTPEEQEGADTFEAIGCADCHVPMMYTNSKFLGLSLPEVMEDPSANEYFRINLRRRAPGFKKSGSGVEVPLFADLKLHDMGPGMTEETGNSLFTTGRLWGIADTAPYLHDGRALTLFEAISEHGGEAQPNADVFGALSEADRAALIAYLNTLKAPRSPNRGL